MAKQWEALGTHEKDRVEPSENRRQKPKEDPNLRKNTSKANFFQAVETRGCKALYDVMRQRHSTPHNKQHNTCFLLKEKRTSLENGSEFRTDAPARGESVA